MKCRRIVRFILLHLIALGPLLGAEANAPFKVASPFTDNAVIQRNQPVPVWGLAAPEAKVTVAFAGQKRSTKADLNGDWHLELEAMPASSEPRTMQLQDDRGNTIQLSNILVGEVWICSGQSNMHMRIRFAPDVAALQPNSNRIRTFEVKNTVAFEEQPFCEGAWEVAAPPSAVAHSFAYFLEGAADVPVGIILTCWGSSSIEAWMPRDMTATVPHFKTMMEEFDANTETLERIQSILEGPRPWPKKDDIFLRRQPNVLFNAMMAPLAPYACRGLVWYQGERNTQSMHGMLEEPWYSRTGGMLQYGATLRQWIQRYRELWQKPDMHFMVVMLPRYFKPLDTGPQLGAQHPATHSWAWMREAQMSVMNMPHTAVINTIDLGDETNIHPEDKLPIGMRLALVARRDTLGEAVDSEGPLLDYVVSKGNKLIVHFTNAERLRTSGREAPKGFWLADDSGEWFPADAEIVDETVVLSSDKLQEPKYIRYAFAGMPEVNLVNQYGLPPYPFRTDRFDP